MPGKIHVIIFLLFLLPGYLSGQETATIYGRVTANRYEPLELVNISVSGYPSGNATDKNGNYEIRVPALTGITVVYSFVGYVTQRYDFYLEAGARKEINLVMIPSATELPDVVIEDRKLRTTTLTRIDPKDATLIPSVSGSSIESLIKTLPGVAGTNELSSQYSVRGGNYDENLVYVNNIEIYRPFLIRSSQQEGLSFLNPDLVSSISFSAGGFDAEYGDKMSSVLDIKYRQPVRFAGSVSLSLLGATMHLEGATPDQRFTYLLGARYKNNQYILKGLETEGDYKPTYTDVQTLLKYRLNDRLSLSFLGYMAYNIYQVEPVSRETAFGAINDAYKFTVYLEGNERDKFVNYMGGLTLDYRLQKDLTLKFITSAFHTIETENFDILGQYWIARLETDYTNEDFGEPTETLGVGSYLDHARNDLNATVFNMEHRAIWDKSRHYIQWGAKYQHEWIEDALSEWELLDSAGFSLPHPRDSVGYKDPSAQPVNPFELFSSVKANHTLSSNRITAFGQDSWTIMVTDSSKLALTYGIRLHYWDMNGEFLVSPRVTLSYKPKLKQDLLFRFSAGYYVQPPFYREMRDFEGNLNTSLKAQKSIHIVLGSDWNFEAWSRPFKFVTEVYYKKMDDLVPYIIDNVRIRYMATNNSHGYAAGFDMKVNGEFVKGMESWASLSFMKTMEDIEDDFYVDADSNIVYPGYIRRPTDQRINFGLFFQDYLPRNPTYRMQMTFLYGTNMPFGPPDQPKYKHVFESSPYLRVDVGFSKQLIGQGTFFSEKNPLRYIENAWISLEVFNLLQHKNTVSYIWVRTIDNYQYPVPNRLTPRQLNVRLVVQF
ncbi:MAG: TonB-dependent receptor [Lentimicrobiaceae bacterium]|nr:TonB-dependent receptor [Lentimicrobiaceae bacterium]